MAKRIIGAFLSLSLVLMLIPASALAFAAPSDEATKDVTQSDGLESSEDNASAENASDDSDHELPATNDGKDESSAMPADGQSSADSDGDVEGTDDASTAEDTTTPEEEVTPSAEEEPAGPLADGIYIMRSALSLTQVIDIDAGSYANGANVQLYQSNMTPAQLFEFTYDSKDGYYTIKNVNSGKVLDIMWGSSAAGTNVWQYAGNDTLAQKWRLEQNADGSFTIVSALSSGLALDVQWASTANYTNVWVHYKNGSAAQKFYMLPQDAATPATDTVIEDGLYNLKSALSSNLSLDVYGASPANDLQMQIWTSNDYISQIFEIKATKDNYYTISPMSSTLTLCTYAGGIVATTPVVQSIYPVTEANKFALVKNADDTYTFINKKSGLAMDVANGLAASGAKVQSFYPNYTAAQKWTLAPVSSDPLTEGIINLMPSTQLSNCLDVSGASRSAGANVQSYSSNATLAQKFRAARVGTNTYSFENINSGLFVTATGTNVDQQAGGQFEVSENQRWIASWVRGGFTLENVATGQFMTLSGSNIAVADADNSASQIFQYKSTRTLPMGMYEIYTPGNKYIDEYCGQTSAGTNIWTYSKNDTPAQKWNLSDLFGGEYFMISCVRSKRVLDVCAGSTAEGTNIWLYDHNGSGAQFFKAIPAGDGWFYLQSYLGQNIYIATSGDGTVSGENLQITTDPANAQKFRFEAITYASAPKIVKDIRPSLSHGPKPAAYQKYIMIHDTEGWGSPASVISYWDSLGTYTAAHFIIGTNGAIYQCVPMDNIAHHAGWGNSGHNKKFAVTDESRDDKRGTAAYWGYPDYGMNSYSIGIELVHVGDGSGYPKAQLEALDDLIAYIDAYYGFESAIVVHNDWATSNSDTSPQFDPYLKNYRSVRSYK